NGSVTFTYDAGGNKLAKTVQDNGAVVNGISTNITTTTTYVNGFIYQSLSYSNPSLSSLNYTNKLQFFAQEEGRVRAIYSLSTPNTMTGLEFDYFLQDHLGNTRAVLTEEQETDSYVTLSFDGTSQDYANQNAVWDNSQGSSINVAATQTPVPSGLQGGDNGTYCGSVTQGIGAAKLIRVMAGDQVNAQLEYSYPTASSDNSAANGWSTLLGSLANMIVGSMSNVSPVMEGSSTATVLQAQQNNSVVSNFFSVAGEVPGANGVPKAYLHILLFNDQFVFDNVNSVVYPITSSGLNARGTIPALIANVAKDGYAYVYFSNESKSLVYFDNFKLTHSRGPLLETNDYYPFGLAMAAVSGMAMKTPYAPNKFRYNEKELQNQEFNSGSGLEEYDFGARLQDPQLGVWHNIDPMAEKTNNLSPYNYALNNPVANVDPDGKFVITFTGQDLINAGINDPIKFANFILGLERNLDNFINQPDNQDVRSMTIAA